jgi:hypothetical protein
MERVMRMRLLAAAVVLALGASACGSNIDLKKDSKITPEVTGWFDAGVTEDGKNKLVPSASFRITNTGTRAFGGVQINCIFRRLGDPEEWSTVFIRGASAGLDNLAPGATSAPIVVRAPQGYTGIQPRTDILQSRYFVDAKGEIFGKAGSAAPVKLGELPIARQLLTK